MMERTRKYPIGIQTFSEIREEGYVYIDKSELVYRLTHSSKFTFLSRPRRFGKSLLASTLRSYFEGRKDLFEGLAIEGLETEWRKHPVLQFSMAGGKHMDEGALNRYLDRRLAEWEDVYGRNPNDVEANDRFIALIKNAYEKTGEKVVVLIDEYDAPLLDIMGDEDGSKLKALRNIMRNFYSPLKDCDPYLRFVFLTGITKFSQLSIFSELNNIENVSMVDDYAGICGITKDELLTQMSDDIDRLAEKKKISRDEAISRLAQNYDGYHFSANSPDIFNPFSLLNCFNRCEIQSFWFGSGTPTFLIEQLQKFGMVPTQLGGVIEAEAAAFDTPTESLTSIIPLLYQSGYLTIKDYDEFSENYTLGIPNSEVRVGLMRALIPNYLQTIDTGTVINKMTGLLLKDDVDGAFALLKKFFDTVPYCRDIDHEGHWQQMLYVVFSLFGARGDCEIHTPDGRIDIAFVLWGKLYLVEVKLDGTAEEALRQIDAKNYSRRFALYDLPIVKVGVNFSTKQRTIDGWQIA